jgi:hypothetical protein
MVARVLALAVLASGCAGIREAMETVVAFAFWTCGEPALDVQPGDRAYFPQLDSDGPQLHYYSEKLDATAIVGQALLDDKRVRWTLADYPGPPREVGLDRLHVWPRPSGLVVTVLDSRGRPRNCATVGFESLEDWEVHGVRPGLAPGTTSSQGVVRFAPVMAGEVRIRRENTFLWFDGDWHPVTLPEGRVLHVVLDGEGLRVED